MPEPKQTPTIAEIIVYFMSLGILVMMAIKLGGL